MRDMLRGMCPFLAPTKNNLNNNDQIYSLRNMNVWVEYQKRQIDRRIYKGINSAGFIIGVNNKE